MMCENTLVKDGRERTRNAGTCKSAVLC